MSINRYNLLLKNYFDEMADNYNKVIILEYSYLVLKCLSNNNIFALCKEGLTGFPLKCLSSENSYWTAANKGCSILIDLNSVYFKNRRGSNSL